MASFSLRVRKSLTLMGTTRETDEARGWFSPLEKLSETERGLPRDLAVGLGLTNGCSFCYPDPNRID